MARELGLMVAYYYYLPLANRLHFEETNKYLYISSYTFLSIHYDLYIMMSSLS